MLNVDLRMLNILLEKQDKKNNKEKKHFFFAM